LLEPEMDRLIAELREIASEKGIELAQGEREIDDVLTYALFTQVGLNFLENRDNPDAFEPAPKGNDAAGKPVAGEAVYTVTVEGKQYVVTVAEGGDISGIALLGGAASQQSAAATIPASGEPVNAPLAGVIHKVLVKPGDVVKSGDCLMILEAMKMETSISAPADGRVATVSVAVGDKVAVGDQLLSLG
jgi:oxaloacetate decarboxylase alpha subunit